VDRQTDTDRQTDRQRPAADEASYAAESDELMCDVVARCHTENCAESPLY